MISYIPTVCAETQNAKVYDEKGTGFTIEAVTTPNMGDIIDSLEDNLEQAIAENIPLKDIVLDLINTTRIELLSELLLKLLVILKDSDHIRRDISILVSIAGLPIETRPDSQVAKEDFNMTRQTYSARKKQLEKKLNLKPSPASKSEKACNSYKLGNRRNIKL